MNKIKIYFDNGWVYIAPPWTPVPKSLELARYNEHHDIGIDLRDGRAYVTNDDYYCNVGADEMKTLADMLEFAASIVDCKVTLKQVKGKGTSWLGAIGFLWV